MSRPPMFRTAIAVALLLAACGGEETSKNNTATNNTATNNTATNNTATNNTVVNCECAAPQPDTCDGDSAVSYEMTCDAPNFACDEVESGRTDCAATGLICMDGACVDDTTDLCANVNCAGVPVGPMCEGDVLVETGSGVCVPATGMCDYSNAETRTDCTATGMVCSGGACIASSPTPNPGDLVITEIMTNPAAVGDDLGEWFELYNASTRELDLQGLTIMDDGGDTFTLPAGAAIPLAAGAYYVLGNNADSATNGGITLDLAYGSDIALANGGDELVVVDGNAVEIDRVNWDTNAGWPSLNGSSLQFGSDSDLAADDNNDPQFWCASTAVYGAGDFGTPGGANSSCAPTTVTIYQISNEADANHPAENAVVIVNGVAITALSTTRMWLQETAGGEYSGVYVSVSGVDVTALAVGDIVDITGIYDENFDLARITATSIADTGNDMTIAPQLLESSVFADAVTAEPWEGVLVRINEAGITDVDLGNGEIMVDSNIIVNDLLFADFSANAQECEVYDSIVGPLNYSFDAFKIEPRDANDVGTAINATMATDITVSGFAFDPAAACIAMGATVTWTNNDAAGHTATSRLASQAAAANANIPATPLFDVTLAASGGTGSYTFAEAGTFHYRCRPHSNMEGVIVVPDP